MRILIGEFRQETNSFNPVVSTMAFWEKAGILHGDEIPAALANKPCAVAGMIKALKEAKADVRYGLSMTCQSGGPADQAVMAYFWDHFRVAIEANRPDGIFLSFHGALQTTQYDDAEGEIVTRIRQIVGEQVVIAVSLDLHAYVSPALVRGVDAIAGYHTYPHVDFFETGYRAARLGLDCFDRGKRPKMACVPLPMIVSAASYNTLQGPFKELMDDCLSLMRFNKIRDFSVFMMQPWLDIREAGSSVVVLADDHATAEYYAKDIAGRLLALRTRLTSELLSIDEVIDKAEANTSGRPVILVDSADSCNAGACGDSMAVAARLLERPSPLTAATVVNDAAAADQAHRLGVGAQAMFSLGATRDPSAVSIRAEGYVRSLHDGVFVQEGPAGRGMVNRIGPTAVIRFGQLDVVVCHWMAGNGDPQLYRAFGIEPTLYRLVVVKACTSFRAAYGQMTDLIYETDTPGAATTNLMRLPFAKLPRSFFPWSDLDDYEIGGVLFGR